MAADPHEVDLRGRVAVVTGSTSGIGLGIARALARRGASIMLNGFGGGAVVAAALEVVKSIAVAVSYSADDVSRPAEVVGLLRQAQLDLGPVDILVNNAGVQY